MKRNGRKIKVNPITKVNPGPSENMENPAVPSLTQKKELPAMMVRTLINCMDCLIDSFNYLYSYVVTFNFEFAD